ncbi:hypothetical protein MNBD_DELTA04-954 [hydrothermal vent metagenome]|uniref:Uncharacterized protein n=1 Tax=hydrothermal vent metagenome TaxID=652676 RepID=A0A3B0VC47_9ZZZZ
MTPEADSRAGDQAQGEQLDSRVIPVMREAVAMVHMVCFGELKDKLADRFQDWEPAEFRRLVGAIVNDIFGTPAQDSESMRFARKHQDTVEKELWALADNLPDLLPPLTDALRMQTLCDHEQGINSLPTLLRARTVGVLVEERPIPMPSTFIILVRQLGARHGMLQPMQADDSASE